MRSAMKKVFGGIKLTWPKVILMAVIAGVLTAVLALADEDLGTVEIVYADGYDGYMVHADFKKAGKTVLTLEAPDGEKTEYDLCVERNTYELGRR